MRLGILGGNVYIDFLISGLVEFPAAFLILFTIDRIGRRLPFATANIVAGAACFITAMIPESESMITSMSNGNDLPGWICVTLLSHFSFSHIQPCSGSKQQWPASAGWASPWLLRWWCLWTLNCTLRLSGKGNPQGFWRQSIQEVNLNNNSKFEKTASIFNDLTMNWGIEAIYFFN